MAPPKHPIFFALEGARPNFGVLEMMLHQLHSEVYASRLLSVDMYYRAATDTALVGMNLDARSVTPTLDRRIRAAAPPPGEILEPSRLAEPVRQHFYQSYLPSCEHSVLGLGGPDDALLLLSEHLGQRLQTQSTPMTAKPVRVRFQRGDTWVRARARSLTPEGVYLWTGAAPPTGQSLLLDLAVGTVEVVMRAMVMHVTSPEAAAKLGIGGFGVRFLLDNPQQKLALDALLFAARGTELTLPTSPPTRREPRYPVSWTVALETAIGPFETVAHNLSRSGMFVADGDELMQEDSYVNLAVSSDRDEPLIHASALAVRRINERVARSRNALPGVGLEIVGFAEGDADRYAALIDRVARRVPRTIVVAAEPQRLGQLSAPLTAAGYSVLGASDVTTLVAKVEALSRAPDLIVRDPTLLVTDRVGERALRKLLNQHRVPVVTPSDDAPLGLREEIDDRLGIGFEDTEVVTVMAP